MPPLRHLARQEVREKHPLLHRLPVCRADPTEAVVTDYLAYATTATGVPITECEVCGQRHPVTRAHCSRCRSWSAFQRSGLCLICSEIVAAHGVSEGSREAIRTPVRYNGATTETAPTKEHELSDQSLTTSTVRGQDGCQ